MISWLCILGASTYITGQSASSSPFLFNEESQDFTQNLLVDETMIQMADVFEAIRWIKVTHHALPSDTDLDFEKIARLFKVEQKKIQAIKDPIPLFESYLYSIEQYDYSKDIYSKVVEQCKAYTRQPKLRSLALISFFRLPEEEEKEQLRVDLIEDLLKNDVKHSADFLNESRDLSLVKAQDSKANLEERVGIAYFTYYYEKEDLEHAEKEFNDIKNFELQNAMYDELAELIVSKKGNKALVAHFKKRYDGINTTESKIFFSRVVAEIHEDNPTYNFQWVYPYIENDPQAMSYFASKLFKNYLKQNNLEVAENYLNKVTVKDNYEMYKKMLAQRYLETGNDKKYLELMRK